MTSEIKEGKNRKSLIRRKRKGQLLYPLLTDFQLYLDIIQGYIDVTELEFMDVIKEVYEVVCIDAKKKDVWEVRIKNDLWIRVIQLPHSLGLLDIVRWNGKLWRMPDKKDALNNKVKWLPQTLDEKKYD